MKTAKNSPLSRELVGFATQQLVRFAKTAQGTFAARGASMPAAFSEELMR